MKKVFYTLIVVAAFLLCSQIQCFADNNLSDTAISYASAASNKFMKQDFQGALDCLDEALKQNPNNPQLYLNRGFVNHFIHNYDEALEDYNQALKVNPNFAFAYNNRGVLKVSMNDIQGAMDDYARALSINNKYADVYYNRANLKYMLDDNKGALEDYDKAIELNPKDSDAYNNRGVVKKRMDLNIGALSDYSQAIALNPKDSIAYANRGHLKKLYFDNEGAAIDLNQAIELAENQVFIKNVKPLLSNQHYIAAIPAVKSFQNAPNKNIQPKTTEIAKASKSAEKQPADTVNKNTVAMATQPVTVKPRTSEQPKIQKSSTSVPKSSATVLSAGIGKVATPEVPDIRTEVVTKKATTNTKLAESYYIRGLQKCILHDMTGAIADLDKAIANNSKYADAYFYRGAIKKELGDTEGFKKDYSTAIQIKPSLQAFNDSNALSLIQG